MNLKWTEMLFDLKVLYMAPGFILAASYTCANLFQGLFELFVAGEDTYKWMPGLVYVLIKLILGNQSAANDVLNLSCLSQTVSACSISYIP